MEFQKVYKASSASILIPVSLRHGPEPPLTTGIAFPPGTSVQALNCSPSFFVQCSQRRCEDPFVPVHEDSLAETCVDENDAGDIYLPTILTFHVLGLANKMGVLAGTAAAVPGVWPVAELTVRLRDLARVEKGSSTRFFCACFDPSTGL
jgi:hypothetical protein